MPIPLEKQLGGFEKTLSLILGGTGGLDGFCGYYINEFSQVADLTCIYGSKAHTVGAFVLDVQSECDSSYDALVICNGGNRTHPLHKTNVTENIGIYQLAKTRATIFNSRRYRISDDKRIYIEYLKEWSKSRVELEQRRLATSIVGGIGKVKVSEVVYNFIQEKLKVDKLFSLQKRGTCAKKNIRNAEELREVFMSVEWEFKNRGCN